MSTKTGHAFVLGAGIAGLSLAEILSRNGWRITLLDSATSLGGDASRCTQNWLHTGWLYAALPYASAMQGCAESLRLFRKTYGSVLPPDVVNVEATDGIVDYPTSPVGWFSPERVHYAFAVASYDLAAVQAVTWRQYLRTILLRRLRKLGYETKVARDLPQGMLDLMNHWEGGQDGHKKYWVIESTDARMDTKRILSSLTRLLGTETTVVLGSPIELERNGDRTAVRVAGELHNPDLVVVAAGKSTPHLLSAVGAESLAGDFKSICSPIVVLRRALDLPNFIRFTPNLPETVNHIRYAIDGRDVSTIGSYDYHPPEARPHLGPFIEKVCRRLAISTDEVIGSYYGTKTELTGALKRRYNHAVGSVNANTFYAIAGKFSQFPLLVNEFAAQVGLRLDISNEERGTLDHQVGPTAPERLLRKGARSTTHAA